jgi:hypothetical protein
MASLIPGYKYNVVISNCQNNNKRDGFCCNGFDLFNC